MMSMNEEKEKRILELKSRLNEICDIVGLDSVKELMSREDEEGIKLKEEKIVIMKEYFDEMKEIKCEIARLQGKKSIFEEE